MMSALMSLSPVERRASNSVLMLSSDGLKALPSGSQTRAELSMVMRMPWLMGSAMAESTNCQALTTIQRVRIEGRRTTSPRRKNCLKSELKVRWEDSLMEGVRGRESWAVARLCARGQCRGA